MSFKYLVLPLFVLPLPLSAATAGSDTELDSMVVTATRTATAPDKLLSSTSIITREDIERFNYQTLEEALRSLPGVVMTNSGGVGKQTALFIRGTESNHTQILLNGVKLATNEFGMPQLEHISLDQIDRIELVRGPQSSLYGSQSIGGTIQIFTKQAELGFAPEFSLSYGSHNTQNTQLGFSVANAKSWFNISANRSKTDGFNACDGRSGTLFIGCFTTEPDDDAYRNTSLSLRAGHQFNKDTTIEVFSLSNQGETEFDGSIFSGNQTDFLQHTFGATFNTAVTDIWSITTSLSQGRMEADNNKNGVDVNFADNKKNYFSLQNDFSISPDYLFSLGYEYEKDEIDTTNTFSETERDNHAYFGQLLGHSGDNNFRLSLRVDDNEQFGHHTTGNIALGRQLQKNLRLFASYGTAFSAPALVDLYSPFGANPDLDPEESTSFEIGLSGQQHDIDWSLSFYQTRIDDLIVLDDSFIPQNISEAVIKGIELTAATTLYGINLDGQVSLMDPENKATGTNNGNLLARRAEQTYSLKAYKTIGAYSISSQFFASGRRFDDAANTRRLAPFNTIDVSLGYKVSKAILTTLKVTNLFNQEYETVSGYNTDGTNLLFTMSYRP